MKNFNRLVASFLVVGLVIGWAQGNAETSQQNAATSLAENQAAAGVNFPLQNPALPDLTKALATLRSEMAQCDTKFKTNEILDGIDKDSAGKALKDILNKDKKSARENARKAVGLGDSAEGCYTGLKEGDDEAKNKKGREDIEKSPDLCSMDCAMPTESVSCSEDSGEGLEKAQKDFAFIQKRMDRYKWFKGLKKNCVNKEVDKLNRAKGAYDCQKAALKKAADAMAAGMRSAIQANQKYFTFLGQVASDMNKQLMDINLILGDKEKGGGLYGVKKKMEEMRDSEDGGAQAFTSSMQESVNTSINKRNESEVFKENARRDSIKACLSTTDAKLSYNGQTFRCGVGASAPPCSPMAYLGYLIGQSKQFTGKGQFIQSDTRAGQAKMAQDDFEKMVNGMIDAIPQASFTSKTSDSSGSTPGEMLALSAQVTRDSMMNRIKDKLLQIDAQSSVNVEKELRLRVDHCIKEGNQVASGTFKDQEQKKKYDDLVAEADKEKVAVLGKIKTRLSKMNQIYGDAWKILNPTGARKSLDRSSCSTSNSGVTEQESQLQCYKDLNGYFDRLYENGNGGLLSARQIPPGKSGAVRGFAIPCTGVSDCVTQYEKFQEIKGKQVVEMGQTMSKFSGDANSKLGEQLAPVGNLMSEFQGKLLSLAATFGATPETSAEPLQPQPPGSDKNPPGPFGLPKNDMAAVGSYMGGGIINFTKDGVKDAHEKAKKDLEDKKKAIDDEIKAARDQEKENKDALKQCKTDSGVGNDPCVPDVCKLLNSCSTSDNNLQKTLNEAVIAGNRSDPKEADAQRIKIENALNNLNGVSDCDTVRKRCSVCLNFKMKAIDDAHRPTGDGKNSDKATN